MVLFKMLGHVAYKMFVYKSNDKAHDKIEKQLLLKVFIVIVKFFICFFKSASWYIDQNRSF
jgi:hypothetical protein